MAIIIKMSNKYDVITFGSASRDIFLSAEQFPVGDFKKDNIKKAILLPFGHKIEIKEIHFYSGGGGTNTAATFSAQELKTAYCGVVGKGIEGEAILIELKEKGIESFIFKTDKKPTNVSVIFSTPKDRTILVYKGASEILNISPFLSKIKETKWLYLAPFSNKNQLMLKKLIDFAKNNKIKIMANPSYSQLNLPLKTLSPILQKIDILLLNQEEAQTLIKNYLLKEEELIKEIKKFFQGILILTNGENKVLVSDESFLYSALPIKEKVLDKTGAGDAFGAGFLSGYIKSGGDIVFSIQMAVANSASCIKKWGAKQGILKNGQKFKKVKVVKKEW